MLLLGLHPEQDPDPSRCCNRRGPAGARCEAAIRGHIDVSAALAQRDYMTNRWSDDGQLPWLQERNIRLFRGAGRLVASRTVAVSRRDGAVSEIRGRRAIVLAVGTRAALPPIPGLAEAQPWTNREATEVKAIPRRLIVLGGGAAGLELAPAFRRLGSEQLTILEAALQLLGREEPFAGEEVRAALEAEGITVVVDASISQVRREHVDGPAKVLLTDGRRFTADELLVAAGRRVDCWSSFGLGRMGQLPTVRGDHLVGDFAGSRGPGAEGCR
jgi:dihydrolipoamide dehydrogenase